MQLTSHDHAFDAHGLVGGLPEDPRARLCRPTSPILPPALGTDQETSEEGDRDHHQHHAEIVGVVPQKGPRHHPDQQAGCRCPRERTAETWSRTAARVHTRTPSVITIQKPLVTG